MVSLVPRVPHKLEVLSGPRNTGDDRQRRCGPIKDRARKKTRPDRGYRRHGSHLAETRTHLEAEVRPARGIGMEPQYGFPVHLQPASLHRSQQQPDLTACIIVVNRFPP